jgi:hypothetical protein
MWLLSQYVGFNAIAQGVTNDYARRLRRIGRAVKALVEVAAGSPALAEVQEQFNLFQTTARETREFYRVLLEPFLEHLHTAQEHLDILHSIVKAEQKRTKLPHSNEEASLIRCKGKIAAITANGRIPELGDNDEDSDATTLVYGG